MGAVQCSHTLLRAWDGLHSQGLASPDPPPNCVCLTLTPSESPKLWCWLLCRWQLRAVHVLRCQHLERARQHRQVLL
jgi:hypothetical protein